AVVGVASAALGPLPLAKLSSAGSSQLPPDPPRLLDEDAPRVLLRRAPLELRFTEPLGGISVDSPTVAVRARVSQKEPHLALIDASNPEPGQEVSLQLTDITGRNR